MKSLAHPRTSEADDDVAARIRKDAAAYSERTPSEHVEASERIASESYREECRRLMRDGKL